ncbi:hypothetical protein [Burkholderia diffusa]|nr:hypothetical protein [Burkholderia diffusa]
MSDIALGSIDRNRRRLDEKMTVARHFFHVGIIPFMPAPPD